MLPVVRDRTALTLLPLIQQSGDSLARTSCQVVGRRTRTFHSRMVACICTMSSGISRTESTYRTLEKATREKNGKDQVIFQLDANGHY